MCYSGGIPVDKPACFLALAPTAVAIGAGAFPSPLAENQRVRARSQTTRGHNMPAIMGDLWICRVGKPWVAWTKADHFWMHLRCRKPWIDKDPWHSETVWKVRFVRAALNIFWAAEASEIFDFVMFYGSATQVKEVHQLLLVSGWQGLTILHVYKSRRPPEPEIEQ